jgi:hypothetical protein
MAITAKNISKITTTDTISSRCFDYANAGSSIKNAAVLCSAQ